MARGYLSLILHAHLPYVRHPEHEDFLEEHWLFEAITETYIPLIQVFEKLNEDEVPYRVAMSVSPSLVNMLADPMLMQRYERRLEQLCELAAREVERTRWMPEFHRLALHYHWLFHGRGRHSWIAIARTCSARSRSSPTRDRSRSSPAAPPTAICR